MSDKSRNSLKPISLAVGAALVTGLGSTIVAGDAAANPFAATDLPGGYMTDLLGEGNCGGEKGEEGACGGDKGEEGACGGEKGEEGACGGAKGEEGACGGAKGEEGACGGAKGEEGKCGAA